MSRIGRLPIPVPDGVEIETSPGRITVKGPKGSLAQELSPDMTIARDGDRLVVTRPTDRADHRALHGLTRSLVANMVEGVTKGYEKRLEIQGVGYRATPKGSDIEFALGFSHTITVKPPPGIEFEVPGADAGRRPWHRQAGRRPGRGQHPRPQAAGALQGQGHPLRG